MFRWLSGIGGQLVRSAEDISLAKCTCVSSRVLGRCQESAHGHPVEKVCGLFCPNTGCGMHAYRRASAYTFACMSGQPRCAHVGQLGGREV
jgi:hypothetical protein